MRKMGWIVVLTALGLAGVTQAAAIAWDGDGGDNLWSTASNWDGDTLPTSGTDTVVIDGSYTVNYDVVAPQNFNDIDVLGGATLNMLTGACTLNGVFNTSTGAIQGGSVINFIGGTHDFATRMAVNGTLRAVGNDATIYLGQTPSMSGSTLDFVFDSDGVSSLNFESYVQGGDTRPAALTVDGSLYTGGSGEFTLLTTSALTPIDNVTVSGFSAEEYRTAVTQDTVNHRV